MPRAQTTVAHTRASVNRATLVMASTAQTSSLVSHESAKLVTKWMRTNAQVIAFCPFPRLRPFPFNQKSDNAFWYIFKPWPNGLKST